uniref:Uncharacterized protein n=1 Tax=Pithovirus LCPAC101 TaxID=2506586 RepID=A0A481Z337_9VIRU|nr:MAG: hypothetical protein LCPAC101_00540 [Pithovirus LCPAC101]
MSHNEYRFHVRRGANELIHGLGATETEYDRVFGGYNNMKGTYASFGLCTQKGVYLIHLCKDDLKDTCCLGLDISVCTNNNHKFNFSVIANDKTNTFSNCSSIMVFENVLDMLGESPIRIASQKRLGKHIVSPLDMLDSVFTEKNISNNK